MFLFNMEDIWELGGSFKATKILKKKRGLIYTEGILNMGPGFDREITAKAVFDGKGNGGILNIDKRDDYKDACEYFDTHAVGNMVIMQNMHERIHSRLRKIVLGSYKTVFLLFIIIALICQFTFMGIGNVPELMISSLKVVGSVLIVSSSVFLIREGMKIFCLDQYYL